MANIAARSRWTRAPKAGKVLVIVSDTEMAHILEVNLSHANLEVISAHNGAEALSKHRTEKPEVILVDSTLPDIDGAEVCRQLKASPGSSHIPVILMGVEPRRKNKTARIADNADHFLTKPFDPKEVVALILDYLTQKKRAENIDRLTGLPNHVQVDNRIASLIEQKETFAAVYIAMDDLKEFNKAYGYAEGDRVIQLLADIVSESVRLFGNADDMAGYLGGDHFIVLSTPWKAQVIRRRIIADFSRRIRAQYANEHQPRGYAAYERLSDTEGQGPVMELRTAVVTNQRRPFYHHLEVIETAAEQIETSKRLAASMGPLGQKAADTRAARATAAARREMHELREELQEWHGVMAWLGFLLNEFNTPICGMKDCLASVETQAGNLSPEQQQSLKSMRENLARLGGIMEGLDRLSAPEQLTASAAFEEVNVTDAIDWVTKQVGELADQRNIRLDIEEAEDIGRILVDRKDFTQGLLYVVRSELLSSPPEACLHVRAIATTEESISIELTNLTHDIPPSALVRLLRGQRVGLPPEAPESEIYPATLIMKALGGNLSITSEAGKGVTYILTVPRKWQSWMPEVHALHSAADISRKDARAELENLQDQLSTVAGPLPQPVEDSLDKLGGKLQELGVLCNRSLFLTDGLHSRLEAQQERVLHQDVELTAVAEAMLTIAREVASSMHVEGVFDAGSARRVAKYAAIIANELKLTEGDRQALCRAALFKDLGLVLSPHDMAEQKLVPTAEDAKAVRARFRVLWKVMSTVPFLMPAMDFVFYLYERFDGNGGPLGVKGDNIPLGSRILAVANAFDATTSGQLAREVLTPRQAIQRITSESGVRFDPDVVNAFLRAWRKHQPELSPSIS